MNKQEGLSLLRQPLYLISQLSWLLVEELTVQALKVVYLTTSLNPQADDVEIPN